VEIGPESFIPDGSLQLLGLSQRRYKVIGECVEEEALINIFRAVG
jgi:hypothetical protein